MRKKKKPKKIRKKENDRRKERNRKIESVLRLFVFFCLRRTFAAAGRGWDRRGRGLRVWGRGFGFCLFCFVFLCFVSFG